MIRTIDWSCGCGRMERDALADEQEQRRCSCGLAMEQIWWGTRTRNAQWDDSTAVMVHVNPATGEVRYPGQHTAKLSAGFERQYLRSLPEVNRFEREHSVTNHVMHYDSNGRAIDDTFRGEGLNH